MNRGNLLSLDDEALINECILDFYKSTGKGGQKKNKTSSAVRLIHKPSGLSATAGERRSQKENRILAIRRLRLEIAFNLREEEPPPCTESFAMNEKNPRFPTLVAIVIDHLEFHNYQVSTAAEAFNLSTGQLIRFLKKHPALWQFVNTRRKALNLNALK